LEQSGGAYKHVRGDGTVGQVVRRVLTASSEI
jgi:hypothetical protein